MTKLISDFDVHKFVEQYYEPVEDKPGFVWFSKRNMQIISIDVLVASIEEGLQKQKDGVITICNEIELNKLSGVTH